MTPDWFMELLAAAKELQVHISIDYNPDDPMREIHVWLKQYQGEHRFEVELNGPASWALDAIEPALKLFPLPPLENTTPQKDTP